MAVKRVHLFVTGRVQGVFFRASTRDTARRLGLTGWVRNLSDGRVEGLFEGEEESLRRLLEWCRRGPAGAAPEKLEPEWKDYSGEFKDFRIRR